MSYGSKRYGTGTYGGGPSESLPDLYITPTGIPSAEAFGTFGVTNAQDGDWLYLNANVGYEFDQEGDWLYLNGVPGIEALNTAEGVAYLYENIGLLTVLDPIGVAYLYENMGLNLGGWVLGEIRANGVRNMRDALAYLYENVT